MLQIIKQDLFEIKGVSYVHCISADRALGAGIAVAFQNRYDLRRSLYRKFGPPQEIFPCVLDVSIGNQRIFNLVTKRKFWHKPTMTSLSECLLELKELMDINNIKTVAMPKIGCGLDRLSWTNVSQVLNDIFDDSYEIIVCYI